MRSRAGTRGPAAGRGVRVAVLVVLLALLTAVLAAGPSRVSLPGSDTPAPAAGHSAAPLAAAAPDCTGHHHHTTRPGVSVAGHSRHRVATRDGSQAAPEAGGGGAGRAAAGPAPARGGAVLPAGPSGRSPVLRC